MNRRKLADWHAVFPRNRPELEKALLDCLHIVLTFRAKLRRNKRARLFGLDQDALQRGLDGPQAIGKVRLAFKPSEHRIELPTGEDGAGQSVGGAFEKSSLSFADERIACRFAASASSSPGWGASVFSSSQAAVR